MTATRPAAAAIGRAGHYAVELAELTPPSLLDMALHPTRPGKRVLEAPSGTGHYVDRYAAAGASVALLDADPEMVGRAELACHKDSVRVALRRGRIPQTTAAAEAFDLVVAPNASFNLLAADAAVFDLFQWYAARLAVGGRLLVELLPEAGQGAQPAFACPSPTWTVDWRRPTDDGEQLTRWRRTELRGALLRVSYRYGTNAALRPAPVCVTLRRLPWDAVTAAAARVGLRLTAVVRSERSTRGLTEALFIRVGGEGARLAASAGATVADAAAYAARYFTGRFRYGQGTEDILAALRTLPPVTSWLDAGAGSESLFWATNLWAEHLTATDIDADRLTRLRAIADRSAPTGAYATALRMAGRDANAWSAIRTSLGETRHLDVLAEPRLPGEPLFDLVTQFGLLGLCPDDRAFVVGFSRLASHARPGGWVAGANWHTSNPARQAHRVHLDHRLLRRAATTSGVELHRLRTVPVTNDPDFTAVTFYTGRKVNQP